MSEIQGLIRESWARQLSKHYTTINEYNHRESKDLSHKITFTNLGGLATRFIEPADIVEPDEIEQLAQQRGVIDLAINPVRDYLITFTSDLLRSVIEARGEENRLAIQLQNRLHPPLPLGTDPIDVRTVTRYRQDEIWLIPWTEVVVLERYEAEG